MNDPDFLITSVDNALKVLDMAAQETEVRVRRVSEVLNVAPSSAHRLLATLAYRNYLVQDPASKIYRPGIKLINSRALSSDILKLRRIMKPHMEELTEVTRESVSLSRLMGDHIEFIDGVESPRTLRASPRVGARLPAHATAGGKVQLARLTSQEVDDLYPDGLKSLTAYTETELPQLRKKLERCKKRGYAISREESTEGISAVSVPIQDSHQRTLAALTVLAPTARMPDERLKPLIELLTSVASAVQALF